MISTAQHNRVFEASLNASHNCFHLNLLRYKSVLKVNLATNTFVTKHLPPKDKHIAITIRAARLLGTDSQHGSKRIMYAHMRYHIMLVNKDEILEHERSEQ